MAPELFLFSRVDLVSNTSQTNNGDRSDTALGSSLNYEAMLCHVPVIDVDADRLLLARESCGLDATIVMVAKDSIGRAQAGGGVVLLSSKDDWSVLQHELGHALFALGDGYTEFAWCSDRAPNDPYLMMPVPNVGVQGLTKWRSIYETSETGGGHWPCLTHPTTSCAMLDISEAFCPVCRAHIQEALDGKRCLPDAHAPRVTLARIFKSVRMPGQTLELWVIAHDESPLSDYRYLIDGEIVYEGPRARIHLPIESLETGNHILEVQVSDSTGNVGSTGPINIYQRDIERTTPKISVVAEDFDNLGWLTLVITGLHAGTLEARIGDELYHTTFTNGFAVFSLPTPPTDARSVTLVGTTLLGQRSKPLVVPFTPPRRVPSSVAILSATIGARPLADIDRIIGEVDIELEIASCSPLRALEIRIRDVAISQGTLTQTGDCMYRGTLGFKANATPGNWVLYVDDFWNNHEQLLISQVSSMPVGACPQPEVLDSIGSYLEFWRIDVPGGVDAQVSVRERGGTASTHAMPPSPTGVLIFTGPQSIGLDMQETALEITASQRCEGLMVASRTDITVLADTVAPKLYAQRFGPQAGLMNITATDGGELAQLRAFWYRDGLEMFFDSYPFEVPIRPGQLRLELADSAGNVTFEELTMYPYPTGTRASCTGDER